ncbi:MAG: hypothetical protein MZV64_13830 [Ignavibacteriales bacterium]|nr:hypothetical protein [Ignavibacteriales bacterium]
MRSAERSHENSASTSARPATPIVASFCPEPSAVRRARSSAGASPGGTSQPVSRRRGPCPAARRRSWRRRGAGGTSPRASQSSCLRAASGARRWTPPRTHGVQRRVVEAPGHHGPVLEAVAGEAGLQRAR